MNLVSYALATLISEFRLFDFYASFSKFLEEICQVPVKPIDWTGVCRLDQFDGLQRGWFRGHYARIGSMGRKHK